MEKPWKILALRPFEGHFHDLDPHLLAGTDGRCREDLIRLKAMPLGMAEELESRVPQHFLLQSAGDTTEGHHLGGVFEAFGALGAHVGLETGALELLRMAKGLKTSRKQAGSHLEDSRRKLGLKSHATGADGRVEGHLDSRPT